MNLDGLIAKKKALLVATAPVRPPATKALGRDSSNQQGFHIGSDTDMEILFIHQALVNPEKKFIKMLYMVVKFLLQYIYTKAIPPRLTGETTMNTQAYGERFETAIESTKFDYKGRKIGYLVILIDNGIDFRACVQNARFIKNEWVAFGATQSSKKFSSQESATAWAYSNAKERIAKLA